MTNVSRAKCVQARKEWVCWVCRTPIALGALYARRAVFPNDLTNQSGAPVVYRAHLTCGRWT